MSDMNDQGRLESLEIAVQFDSARPIGAPGPMLNETELVFWWLPYAFDLNSRSFEDEDGLLAHRQGLSLTETTLIIPAGPQVSSINMLHATKS